MPKQLGGWVCLQTSGRGSAPVAGGCSVGAWFSRMHPERLQAPCSAALYFMMWWSPKLGFRRSTSRRVRAWQSPSAFRRIMPCTPAKTGVVSSGLSAQLLARRGLAVSAET